MTLVIVWVDTNCHQYSHRGLISYDNRYIRLAIVYPLWCVMLWLLIQSVQTLDFKFVCLRVLEPYGIVVGFYIPTMALSHYFKAHYKSESLQFWVCSAEYLVLFLNCVSCTDRQELTFFCLCACGGKF